MPLTEQIKKVAETVTGIGRLSADDLAELVVVPVPFGHGLLEDGRVRRHSGDGVLLHHPLELAGLEPLARERVDPDRLPELGNFVKA